MKLIRNILLAIFGILSMIGAFFVLAVIFAPQPLVPVNLTNTFGNDHGYDDDLDDFYDEDLD